MKNLITAVGCTLLLMAVLLQFVQSQNTALRLAAVDNAVSTFRETVRQEGCVSEENEDDLKEELSKILDCKPSDILVDGDRIPKERGSFVMYEISVTVSDLVADIGFWGMDEEDSEFEYRVKRYAASEYTDR
ncbi:MAG TPA: hypothetical protein IAB13_04510 [Candidatus Avanaerovorax faecigallinarum]|nr:hypothetical protein [Candidatus Avanaerovorax faecigallinarum]